MRQLKLNDLKVGDRLVCVNKHTLWGDRISYGGKKVVFEVYSRPTPPWARVWVRSTKMREDGTEVNSQVEPLTYCVFNSDICKFERFTPQPTTMPIW